MNRRDFLSGLALSSAGLTLTAEAQQQQQQSTQSKAPGQPPKFGNAPAPVMICKSTGIQGLDGGYEILRRGGDTLRAALFVCKVQEDDPRDDSVGLGGLPNEEGEVELDACCMHGPTRRAGAVASVRNIRNVAELARVVMERTNHLLLVGEGAQRFAVAHGFTEENLLTEQSRRIWLLWKEGMSDQDSWGPGITDPKWKPPVPRSGSPQAAPNQPTALAERYQRLYALAADLGIAPDVREHAVRCVLRPPTGTIHVSACNERGEVSGATTTSGLAWKIPGRVGDSPVIGAGCWTDQDVGSAGATGSGEENIKIAGAHTIVENMRRGMEPAEAGLDALRRIARNHNNDMTKLRYLSMTYYILRKDGKYAGVSLWSQTTDGKKAQFAVIDGNGKRIEDTIGLFQGSGIEWPPIPDLPPLRK